MFLLTIGALVAVAGRGTSLQILTSGTRPNCADDTGAGRPLYLTPYVESGQIDEGRKAAQVAPLLDNITSFSGFLTVDKDRGSNIFFWFFPAEESPDTAPVAFWLQGGPGSSSMFAIFTENGPFFVGDDSKLVRRTNYWSQKLNMIFIDQPVGTGFSFTESNEGYANNEDDVSRDVHNALLQFFKLFPEYENNEFYLTGESYAGKYIPSVGYRIHQLNQNSSARINLKGLAIGNGWVDPYSMIDYSTLLYDLNFIDLKTKYKFAIIEEEIRSLIKKGDYEQGNAVYAEYFAFDHSLVMNVTGIENVFNYLKLKGDNDDVMDAYLNRSDVRRSIHVGNTKFNPGEVVYRHLYPDNLVSTVTKLEALMDNYRVLLYNGQLDIICAYSLTMNYVRKLKWAGADDYRKAERKQWYVGKDLAGYSKSARNFTELLIRDAGHMVPGDQPLWALDMITNFAFNRPLKSMPHELDGTIAGRTVCN